VFLNSDAWTPKGAWKFSRFYKILFRYSYEHKMFNSLPHMLLASFQASWLDLCWEMSSKPGHCKNIFWLFLQFKLVWWKTVTKRTLDYMKALKDQTFELLNQKLFLKCIVKPILSRKKDVGYNEQFRSFEIARASYLFG